MSKSKTAPLRDAIPDLAPLYERVRAFVKERQGDKGYIDTQDDSNDTIYTFVYLEEEFRATDMKVHGVRVNPADGELEIIYDSDVNGLCAPIDYTDADFRSPTADWHPVRDDEEVYYIPTLFNLAEFLEEYAGDEV